MKTDAFGDQHNRNPPRGDLMRRGIANSHWSGIDYRPFNRRQDHREMDRNTQRLRRGEPDSWRRRREPRTTNPSRPILRSRDSEPSRTRKRTAFPPPDEQRAPVEIWDWKPISTLDPKSRLQLPSAAPHPRQSPWDSWETAGIAIPLQRRASRSQTLTHDLEHIERGQDGWSGS